MKLTSLALAAAGVLAAAAAPAQAMVRGAGAAAVAQPAAGAEAAAALTLSDEFFAAVRQSTNQNHYGDPNKGCMSDEVAIRVQGLSGGICTPHCSVSGACPSDKPDECEAAPRCVLENRATGERFCALLCQAGMSCGHGASCKIVSGGMGICTYDDVRAKTYILGEEDQ